jgi:hypothetical protein
MYKHWTKSDYDKIVPLTIDKIETSTNVGCYWCKEYYPVTHLKDDAIVCKYCDMDSLVCDADFP